MTAGILFNPNQALIFSKKQKLFLNHLNEEKMIAHPFYPLFLNFNDSRLKNLKPVEIKKIIKNITINEPEISGNQIIFPAKIETSDFSVEEKIIAGKLTEKNPSENKKKSFSYDEEKLFPVEVKNFRIAQIEIIPETNSFEIWNDIWCKLK